MKERVVIPAKAGIQSIQALALDANSERKG